MLDYAFVDHEFAPVAVDVDAGLLKLFAKATGQTNPIYFDRVAAQAAGYRDIVAPPTYAFSLQLRACDVFPIIPLMQLDQRNCLHGEQKFRYHHPIVAGDCIALWSRITDVYEKAGGRLGFVVVETQCRNQEDKPVVDMRITTVVRQA